MDLNRLDWMLSRGAGFAAFVLLSAAVIAGLALSLRWTTLRWPGVVTNELHRTLTTLALWMTGLHLVTLLADSESGFGLGDVLVPFAAGYRPAATALGILGLYATLVVAVTTKLRGRIGYRRWRQLHGIAFVAYAAALFHGILAGTSNGAPWATFVYLTSATLVGGLVLLRVLPGREPRGTPRSPGTPSPAPAVAEAPARELPPLPPRSPRSAGTELPRLRG